MSIFDLLKHDADLHNKLSNKQKTTNGINETIGNTNGNINTTNVFNQVEKITVTNVFVLNNSSSTDGKQEAFANSDIDRIGMSDDSGQQREQVHILVWGKCCHLVERLGQEQDYSRARSLYYAPNKDFGNASLKDLLCLCFP